MKRVPTLSAIEQAERRMELSRREVRAGVHRVQHAFRETVTRPSTLAAAGGIAGLAGLAGFLWARRPRPPARYRAANRGRYAKGGAGLIAASSLAAVGRFLVSRYGVRGLTLVVRQVRKTWEQRNAARNAAGNSARNAGRNFAQHTEQPGAAGDHAQHYPATPL